MPKLHLPSNIREAILTEVYRQADDMDWELMPSSQKTQQYRRWVQDAGIGGELQRFGASERDAGVWLKDVPMKEYARAQEGFGAYARYAVRRFKGTQEIVRAACGDGWHVEDGSLGDKPDHFMASDGNVSRYVCWGKAGKFPDLIWAAMNIAIDSSERPVIVITTRDGVTVSSAQRDRHLRVAEHCGVDLRHLHRTLIPNPDYLARL
ncbi:hypothetical protein [Streptomyces sp. 1222.5]|uniref:hypothetical protein n=1 Tax=Streptomyces sp. 1222.5 TaxID=1881026 RepID=UPI003D7605B3